MIIAVIIRRKVEEEEEVRRESVTLIASHSQTLMVPHSNKYRTILVNLHRTTTIAS